MGAGLVELWLAMGILAKLIVLGLAVMLVALPVLAVKLARRGTGARTLGTIAASAPLLGVLGTVLGLMNASVFLSRQEEVPVRFIAAGVGEALLTTALGLVIGLAALWLRAAFDGRAATRGERASAEAVVADVSP